MSAQTPAVTLTPAEVEAGSPELIRVAAPAGARLEGDWLGEKLAFFRGRDGQAWYALAGVDVEAPVGPSESSDQGDAKRKERRRGHAERILT